MKVEINNRCLGRFNFPLEIVNNFEERISLVMKDIISIQTIFDNGTKEIKYIGISKKHFRELSTNENIPDYVFNFDGKEIKAVEIIKEKYEMNL